MAAAPALHSDDGTYKELTSRFRYDSQMLKMMQEASRSVSSQTGSKD
jgi:hypothetical protein